jgi:hypothetical protein
MNNPGRDLILPVAKCLCYRPFSSIEENIKISFYYLFHRQTHTHTHKHTSNAKLSNF